MVVVLLVDEVVCSRDGTSHSVLRHEYMMMVVMLSYVSAASSHALACASLVRSSLQACV
jgi:hypothetical protein